MKHHVTSLNKHFISIKNSSKYKDIPHTSNCKNALLPQRHELETKISYVKARVQNISTTNNLDYTN